MAISEDALKIVYQMAKEGDFSIAQRQKNIDTFDKLCFVPPFVDDVALVICGLKADDCTKGPEKDGDGFPGEIYVFRKQVRGMNLYIKLRLLEQDGMMYLTVLSFHI